MQFRSAIHERETRSSTIPHFPQEFKQCRGLREEDFRRPARGIHAWTLRAETRRAFRAWLEERRPCSELKELRRWDLSLDGHFFRAPGCRFQGWGWGCSGFQKERCSYYSNLT